MEHNDDARGEIVSQRERMRDDIVDHIVSFLLTRKFPDPHTELLTYLAGFSVSLALPIKPCRYRR